MCFDQQDCLKKGVTSSPSLRTQKFMQQLADWSEMSNFEVDPDAYLPDSSEMSNFEVDHVLSLGLLPMWPKIPASQEGSQSMLHLWS